MTHTTSNFKSHIYALIAEIGQAERITKAKLSILSRDLLTYVMDSNDIEAANRLLAVLTPVNHRVAVAYFTHFLPWQEESDKDGKFLRFGKKLQGDKKIIKKRDAIIEWLSDEANDIWLWADKNIEVAVKQKDFAGMVQRAVSQALKGDEKSDTPPLDKSLLIAAIIQGGVTLDEMLQGMDDVMSEQADEEATAEAERQAGEVHMYGDAA